MTQPLTTGPALLREVYRRVGAYRDFLTRHGAGPDTAWEQLPLTGKQDYLLAYPLERLCWDESLRNCHLIGCSSGFSKSGSIFWPKRPQDEGDYLGGIRSILCENYAVDRKRTLILVCLAFGTWIGGMQLATAVRSLAARGDLPVTATLPGLNLDEAAEIVARFQGHFEQFLWLTNPSNIPLVAHLLERRGVDSRNGRHRFAVVGEYFTEGFREWVAARFGHPCDDPFCVWTGYGSADTGGVGVETAPTIALRKWFQAHPERCRERFKVESPPMILELTPHVLVEVVEGNLVVTKDQLIPLVRYDTRDAGGLLARADCPDAQVSDLPEQMVYVFGRASDALIFYGTNLMLSDLSDFLLQLPAELAYGGLFTIRPTEQDGIASYDLAVYVGGSRDAAVQQRYQQEVLGFLRSRSLEFSTKFEALSRALGQPLIRVELRDAGELKGQIKHHYRVEA